MNEPAQADEARTLPLETRLDLAGATRLHAQLLGHLGADLRLDASACTHIGAPGLQVLRAAARSWARDGRRLALAHVSDALRSQIETLGFDPDLVTHWPAAPGPAADLAAQEAAP